MKASGLGSQQASPGRIDLADVLVAVGWVMLAAGLAGYDWRLALVVCGVVLLAVGLWSAGRGRGE